MIYFSINGPLKTHLNPERVGWISLENQTFTAMNIINPSLNFFDVETLVREIILLEFVT